ncbi:MAG: TrmH family RNA methyltransferase [Myxococcota bacterium]
MPQRPEEYVALHTAGCRWLHSIMTPERFATLRAVLGRRQSDLTVLMENVHKPHNYSAVLRSCDAVGIYQAHAIASSAVICTTEMTSAGADKWVDVQVHDSIVVAAQTLRRRKMTSWRHIRQEAP